MRSVHGIVTGPVARFARQIAGQGYIVAAPSSYHDFTGPEPLAYDVPGTDQGNEWKIAKVSKLISCLYACGHVDINITGRHSSHTTKTPTNPSTTSFPCPPAPAALAQQACASAATSPCAPPYAPLLSTDPHSPVLLYLTRYPPARPPHNSLSLLLRHRRPHAHPRPLPVRRLLSGRPLALQPAHAGPPVPATRRDGPDLRAQGHPRARRRAGPDPRQAARRGRRLQLPRVRVGAARLHPRRAEQGAL